MRFSLLIFSLIFLNLNAQSEKSQHILFVDSIQDNKNVISKSGGVNFFINKNLFYYDGKIENCKTLKISEMQEIEFIDISAFLDLSDKIRLKKMSLGNNKNTIKIVGNHEVFDQIYLYRKIGSGMINRYKVVWIDSIE